MNNPGHASHDAALSNSWYLDTKRWRLHKDAVPALEELSSSGWKHALMTNYVPESPEIAGRLEKDRHVERIFNSAQTGYEKPQLGSVRDVLDALGEAEKVWMVDDNADVAGAKAASIPAILVRKRRRGIERYCEVLGGLAAIVDG